MPSTAIPIPPTAKSLSAFSLKLQSDRLLDPELSGLDGLEPGSATRVHIEIDMEAEMKALIGCAALALVLATVSSADAKGCLKGAAAGGVAGHFAGHHGLLGAAAGCIVGRHQANKRDRMQGNPTYQPNRELHPGDQRI
jgi:hypothetical protein